MLKPELLLARGQHDVKFGDFWNRVLWRCQHEAMTQTLELVDGFAVLASIRAELVITITMAVASRAPLSGKLPTPPKIRDSDGGSQNSSHYFWHESKLCDYCVTRCESSCRGDGLQPKAKSFNIGRSDGFLLFRSRRIRTLSITDLTFAHYQGEVFRLKATKNLPNNKLWDDSAVGFLILISALMSLPATPFWFLYESHRHWRGAFPRLLWHDYLTYLTLF